MCALESRKQRSVQESCPVHFNQHERKSTNDNRTLPTARARISIPLHSRVSRRCVTKLVYWLLERCQYSILVAFASILKILQYPGGCQYTGSGGQYTGSGCLTYCHYMAVRLVLLQCFGVLH